MDDLYGHSCSSCEGLHNTADSTVEFSAEALEKGLRKIYDGLDVKNVIERFIFEETLRLFNRATAEGLSDNYDEKVISDRFLEQLRTNNAVFSAFRTHRMQNDIARLMTDEKGRLKPFEQFRMDVAPLTGKYCKNWLQTEYSTAVIRAHRAADWKRFEDEADVLPNLRWMPTTSPNQDPLHRQYWEKKLTLPVGHPFWDEHRPGDRWNCKCMLKQTDEPVNDEVVRDLDPVPAQPGLDSNPAKNGKIFSETHQYFTHTYPGAEKAVKNMDYVVNNRVQIKVLDGSSNILTGKVVKVENEIRMNKKFETAVIFDKTGNILIDKRGQATSVAFSNKEVSLMKDGILTHNHPRGWGYGDKEFGRIGNSFSRDDIELAIHADIAEIRAVTPNYTFSLKRPKNGWNVSIEDFRKLHKEINNSIFKENMAAINLGNILPEQANAIHFHVLNRTLAKQLGWTYEKKRTK